MSIIDEQGNVQAIFRYPDADLTVQDGDRDWFKARVTEMASPQELEMLPMMLESFLFPETRAAYSDLKLDGSGATWVRSGRHLRVAGPSREWTVFGDTGALLGTVMLPDRFEPFEFGRDQVLGVWKDEMDVEFVRVYAIEKG